MANVLNPEPESITLNTELETPTLDPATELEQPSFESTSNLEPAEATATHTLDADATSTQPVAAAEIPAASAEPAASEAADDFSAALEAFEREQAAEAAAVEAYGDKLVPGTVVKQTEK